MNTRQIKTLAIVLIILLAVLFATKLSNDRGDSFAGGLLFPDLKAQINEISLVSISKAGQSVTLRNDAGKWMLDELQNYPVDTGKLRQLLLALANAKKLEEKTSNPEMYERLGVQDTAADNQGTEIRIAGPDSESSLILGNLAQRKYRYARIAGETKSWLIDQNPTLPIGVSGWLLLEILNIDSSDIQSVTITHSDGETIRIEKDHRAASDFTVPDIPDGRELSYASVVDSIAGVLAGLNLEDVPEVSVAEEDDSSARTVFTTFDGLEITVDSLIRDEKPWITINAIQSDSESDEATKINERVGGWTYQIQSYKGDQLRRRWDDILKAEE